jgi:hypothetical protein
MGGVTVASAKSLKSQLEKLNEKIKKQQEALAGLREKRKGMKTQLDDARKAEKARAGAARAK